MRRPFPIMPVNAWPDRDRGLWRNAMCKGDFLSDAGFAADWRPDTIRGCERGYGLFLHWLDERGALHADAPPCHRVTREMITELIATYSVGRAERTVAALVRDIAYVLRALAPPHGVSWLTKLAHRMVNTAQPSRPKLPRMARVGEIVAMSEMLMVEGLKQIEQGRRSGLFCVRDGLMIGLLIRRPLRRRNLAALRIGHNLTIASNCISIRLREDETKTRVPIEFPIPTALLDRFRIYLEQVRPKLLERNPGPDEGWLWIGRSGKPLPPNKITTNILRLSRAHLGRDLCPHLFRDCAATEIAIEDPEHIGITQAILGHTKLETSQRFYNQATSFQAFARYGAVIKKLRER